MSARLRLFACAAALVAQGACAHLVPSTGPAPQTSQLFVTLHGHALRLHLSMPPLPAAARDMLIYATGDGGWWGKD